MKLTSLNHHVLAFVIVLALPCLSLGAQTGRFDFKQGDVVVLTGGANIERTRFNGSLQTLLIAANPDLRLRIRNMGWEGDTVFELWRDDKGEPWRRPRDWQKQLAEAGATVVLAQFGQMESLRGAARLGEFVTAYDQLLDQFAVAGRRLVLLSPIPFERPASSTLPDLSARNGDVLKYVDAIRSIASRRGMRFVDLYKPLANRPRRGGLLTDNGFHLNDHGHAIVAEVILQQLGFTPRPLAALEPARKAVVEMERLWFDYWRPMNWSFLEGDRTQVPFSRDWHDQNVRLFPEEMKEYVPILQQAEENIQLALEGQPVKPIQPRSPIPVESPPTPPQTPDEELATLKIHPDYEVNLFASERDGIVKPIQMRWDERGRLWVACTVSYPQVKPGEKANDRIVICEDTDGDGRADKFTTFVDGLFMPTGLELGDGGLYVCQGTELLHFRDTNGDGRADSRRVVLGGFGTSDAHQMINCPSWGFGGELWFTQGHHIYSRVETPNGVEHLNRAGVWRWRPRTLRLDPFFQMSSAGQNDWGVLTDGFGQVFHMSGATIGAYYSVPGLIRSDLALDSEVMRLFKTRAKHVGFDFIGSRHFPESMQGLVVIGGYYDNTLQIHQLDYRDGIFSSRQLPQIIETTNTVFRPIDVHLGPDGAIYFADWYNPIIGHYQASYRHPDRDKSHGRIWRVRYKGRPVVKPPALASAPIAELFRQLDSPERWVKYQARRLLFEKDSIVVVAALDRWLDTLKPGDPRDESLRLQGLGLYESHETVRPKLLDSLLRSPDFRVRAYATRVIGNWRERVPGALKHLERQAADEHPRVRLEAVVAASYLTDPAAVTVATRVLDRPMDSYLEHALTKAVDVLRPRWEPALTGGMLRFSRDEHLIFALTHPRLDNTAALIRKLMPGADVDASRRRPWLLALAAVGGPEDLRVVADSGRDDTVLLDALAAEAQVRKVSPAGDLKADVENLLSRPRMDFQTRAIRLAGLWQVNALSDRVQSLVADQTAASPLRVEAFGALARLRGKDSAPLLIDAFDKSRATDLAIGALEAVSRVSLVQAAQLTVKRLNTVSNATEAGLWLRPMLQARGGYAALTGALKDGALQADQGRLALAAVNNAGRYDKPLVERLSKLAGFSSELPVYNPDFIRDLAEQSRRTGNAAEGRKVYDMLGCAACHTINSEGGKIGPDLSALGRGLPVDGVIVELIWPQLNVKEGFEAVSITTRDGRVLEGLKHSETADEVALRDTLNGEITRVRRSQIERVRAGGTIMPEGLTSPLNRQQLSDLIRYLAGLGK